MMADTGGNAGSQSATVVVRAIALGQITTSQWLQIIWKEIKIASMLAICLGMISMAKVSILSYGSELPIGLSLSTIAGVISMALAVQVVTSSIVGAGLPLIVKRFGGDPAVAASPAITTIVDISGLLIYFSFAKMFLGI